MKMRKSLPALFLMLMILVVQLCPPAYAEDTTGTLPTGQTWEFDAETGTLTVTGTGALPNYSRSGGLPENPAPWKAWATEIKTVVLSEGITSTGECTFYALSNLTDLQLPNTLQIIDRYAFSYTAITKITFPDSLTTVRDYAFKSCTNLKELHFPASLKEMGDHIFDYCTSYAKVYFHGDLPNTPGMHYQSAHLNIFYPKGNETWAEENRPPWDGDIVLIPFSDCINEHTYGGWVNIIEPTPDEEGLRQRVCVVCKHIDTETIPKWGSNSSTTTPSTQPATAPSTQPTTSAPPTTTPPATQASTPPASSSAPATSAPATSAPAATEQAGTTQSVPSQTDASTTVPMTSPAKDPVSSTTTVVLAVIAVTAVLGGGAVWFFLRKRK